MPIILDTSTKTERSRYDVNDSVRLHRFLAAVAKKAATLYPIDILRRVRRKGYIRLEKN